MTWGLNHEAASVPPELVPWIVFLLVLSTSLGMLYVLFHDRLSGHRALLRRLELSGAPDVKVKGPGGAVNEQRRKQSIENSLNEMAQRERAKQRAKLTLRMRLDQAGLSWTAVGFHVHAAAAAVIGVLLARLAVGLTMIFALPLGALLGYAAVHF